MHRTVDSRPSCLRFAVPFLREILPEEFPSVSRRRARRLGTTGNRGHFRAVHADRAGRVWKRFSGFLRRNSVLCIRLFFDIIR